MNLLKCPVCGQSIEKYSRNYVCPKGHAFDIAKQGYSNFLLNYSGTTHGDSKEMLVARNLIQEKGFYKSVATKIIEILSRIEHKNVVDIGCGTGYYTSLVQNQFQNNVYGIDISKDALKIAARGNKEVTYIVASNNDLPIVDNSIDLVLNVFSPIYLDEAFRVLKDKGYILVVSANENHLIELKEIIYDLIIKKEEDRNVLKEDNLSLVSEENVIAKITLNNEDLNNLFRMTPHYWTSSVDGKDRLSKIESLKVQLNINFSLYRYENKD